MLASYSFKLVSNKSGLALSLHQVGNRLRLKVGHGPIQKKKKKVEHGLQILVSQVISLV